MIDLFLQMLLEHKFCRIQPKKTSLPLTAGWNLFETPPGGAFVTGKELHIIKKENYWIYQIKGNRCGVWIEKGYR